MPSPAIVRPGRWAPATRRARNGFHRHRSDQPVPRVQRRRRLAAKSERAEPKRTIRNAERKAFEALGLEVSAEAVEIKARFKELVKRHHPDANGGDRVYEEKLREIITAYKYLKSVKLC